ncbi:MAG: hypothetical protein N3A61_04535, partial [Ignavibacteria bacterium]|nr:hypothetical protein [Ignavibacteria bacterium]
MKKLIVILFLSLVLTRGLAQPLTEISIISENQNSIVLEFTPKVEKKSVIGENGVIFTKFDFFDCQVNFDSLGQVDFFRTVLLLLPTEEFSLKVISSEYYLLDSIKLIPRPVIKPLKDFGASVTYSEPESINPIKIDRKERLVEMVNVGKTSVGLIGTLVFHPIHKLDKEKVKIYTRVRVKIDFKESFNDGLLPSSLMRGELRSLNIGHFEKSANISKNLNNNYPFAQGNWYRIEIQEAGMYKLDYNYFRQLGISYNDINHLRLFGNGGEVIPESNTSLIPDSLIEIPRYVVRKNASGEPHQDDYVIFYGRGVNGWKYLGNNNFQHYINPYTEKNYYFFTFDPTGGKSMDTISGMIGQPAVHSPTTVLEKIFIE